MLDKTGIAAGASGIACGVIRNNYFQPAMRRLMAHSVSVWESDPEAFSYHPVGYMQISPEVMHEDVATISEQQKEIGYTSVFIEGEADCMNYMKGLFDDWQAKGITSVLHEKKGGYANNTRLDLRPRQEGRGRGRAHPDRASRSPASSATTAGAVTAVDDRPGAASTATTSSSASALGSSTSGTCSSCRTPSRIKGRDGKLHDDVPMWTYWCLQEGTLGVDPKLQRTNDGKMPPVIHVDTDAPLYSDVDGSLITDKLWGIYYKPDFNFGGVQGGAMPYKVETAPDEVAVDPYGPESPDFVVGDDFAHMWCSALAFCQKRFEGQMPKYKKEPSGGIGCFTADSFPVFDVFCENVYVIADSNHGYKMIGVGKLVADDIIGKQSDLLRAVPLLALRRGQAAPGLAQPVPVELSGQRGLDAV